MMTNRTTNHEHGCFSELKHHTTTEIAKKKDIRQNYINRHQAWQASKKKKDLMGR